MVLTGIPNGSFSRWAFGVIILTYLTSFNESGSVSTLVAVLIASLSSLLMVYCKDGLNQLQINYLRASHRWDFLCLFLALWMELLGLIATCAAISRTMSFCLDAMSGGLVRLYILGRNSSINEPWPDVLGVVVVFILSGMFILGLENSKIFSVLMITGVLCISGFLASVTYLRGNIETWLHDNLFIKGLPGILSTSALLTVTFPCCMPTGGKYLKLKAAVFALIVVISISLVAGCLSTIVQVSNSNSYETVPILRILETKDLHKAIPAVGCLYVIACSGALLEIFPETFKIIVRLATSEWKILLKQISYESRDSGSPILAVFVCGSLVAILAFACPMKNMTYIIAASHLVSGILRASYFLYSPFRPKTLHPKQDSTLNYSRLSSNVSGNNSNAKPSLPKRTSLWFLNKAVPSISTQSLSKSLSKLNKNTNKEEMEREWLLLGEPSSPIQSQASEPILESSITSDIECIANANNSDSDSSEEDIDQIVEEFQQKLKVSSAGLQDTNVVKIPSMTSWKFAIFSMFTTTLLSISAAYFSNIEMPIIISLTSAGVIIVSLMMLMIPRYTNSYDTPSVLTCNLSILINCVLLSFCYQDSWLAIVFWFLSGIVLVIQSITHCDILCCICLDYPQYGNHGNEAMSEQLIPNESGRARTIRLGNPPKGSSIINQVQSQR